MSGRIVNVRPKPGYVLDSAGMPVPARRAVPFHDGALTNFLTGRGTSVDKSAFNFWAGATMPAEQIEAAYRNSWLVRQIVDIPADDQTRAGRDWDAEDGDIEKIEAEEKRLGYWAKVRQALIYGRLGGGALFINLGDNPARPLPQMIRPEQIESLVPLYRTAFDIGTVDDNVRSPFFREPSEIKFRSIGRNSPTIHRTRLIFFKGQFVPGMNIASDEDVFWGDSIVQTVNEAVQNATTATAGFATLIDEAKVDVFTMPGMYETLAQPGGEAKFAAALDATARGKSLHRMLALGEGETWETRELNFAGAKDLITTYLSVVAGAADIPATRLLGKSPDGLNATGESDLANYFQAVQARQETDLRPALEKLDAVVLPSAGVVADDLTWSFSPLRVLTEQQMAEIEAKEAETFAKLHATGAFSDVALEESFSNRMVESGRWPGYGEKRDEQIASGDFEPSDEEEDPSALVAGMPGQPGALPAPRTQAANDASPRTLYIQRKLLNADEFIRWAKSQGFDTTATADEMHVTVCYSRTPVDWMKVGQDWHGDEKGQLVVPAGGARIVEPLGDKGAVVLLFGSSALSWRHEEIIRNGASHDFDEYQPHVTITYAKPEGLDLATVEPFRGALRFGPEIFEELDEGWRPSEG